MAHYVVVNFSKNYDDDVVVDRHVDEYAACLLHDMCKQKKTFKKLYTKYLSLLTVASSRRQRQTASQSIRLHTLGSLPIHFATPHSLNQAFSHAIGLI